MSSMEKEHVAGDGPVSGVSETSLIRAQPTSQIEHQHHHQHEHGHRHDHTQGMTKHSLRLAFFLTMVILVAEVTGGLLANSLALLSDAGHVITDLFAFGLAWFASVQIERPSNERKTFGYYRVGILAALLNAVTLIVIALAIIWEAIQRFQRPEVVQPLAMFLAAGIGIVVNLAIGFGLRKENDLNARAAFLHVIGDIGASVGVIVAGLIILLTGWTPIDPLLSIAIALLIAIGAWRILRETTEILLEASPKDIPMKELVRDIRHVQGVQNVHDLHVWSITNGMYALSCHILIDNLPLSSSSRILQAINAMLGEKYHIGHTTIQFENNNHKGACCEMDGLYCDLKGQHRMHDEHGQYDEHGE